MKKILMATITMSLLAFAGAQTINPTVGDNGDDQISVNNAAEGGTGLSASVKQTVNLKLPQATALHLDTSALVFDIAKIGQQGNDWYCAYGVDDPIFDNGVQIKDDDNLANDVVIATDDEFWGQNVVLPLGTYYEPVMTGNPDDPSKPWGQIKVVAGKKATSYPAIDRTAKEVDNKDKAYFVCYRTFYLQKFSNVGNFKLSVSRDTPTGDKGKQLLYIQDNPCDFWGEPTGLYNLPVGGTRELIPRSMTTGTTGHRAAAASNMKAGDPNAKAVSKPGTCRSYTSWLDDLVVVAVVIDGDMAGDNIATLTYTLTSSTTPYALAKK